LSYSRKRILEKWKKYAPHLYWGPRFDVRFHLVSEVLKYKGFNSILDIGCGPGIILSEPRINLKIGIDISKEFITIAKKVDTRNMFLICDMTRLPFKSDFFDAVIAAGIMEIPNLKGKIELKQEIHRVLRNHGVLFLSTVNGQHRRYMKYRRPLKGSNIIPITKTELKRILKGFSFKKIIGYNPLPTQNLFWRIPGFEKIVFFLTKLNLFSSLYLFFYVRAVKE
jgi:SAM-dependent methyltransferase